MSGFLARGVNGVSVLCSSGACREFVAALPGAFPFRRRNQLDVERAFSSHARVHPRSIRDPPRAFDPRLTSRSRDLALERPVLEAAVGVLVHVVAPLGARFA